MWDKELMFLISATRLESSGYYHIKQLFASKNKKCRFTVKRKQTNGRLSLKLDPRRVDVVFSLFAQTYQTEHILSARTLVLNLHSQPAVAQEVQLFFLS